MIEQQLKKTLEAFCQEQGALPGTYNVMAGLDLFGRPYAVLVWSKFDSMEVSQRQVLVWAYVRKHMPVAQSQKISLISTKGAQEWTVEEELAIQKPSLPWS